jgi:hypothetical protein
MDDKFDGTIDALIDWWYGSTRSSRDCDLRGHLLYLGEDFDSYPRHHDQAVCMACGRRWHVEDVLTTRT